MICEAFIIAWNEIETIHLTIKHYQKFCDKVTILDNYSDDGTPEKAGAMGCDVRTFGISGQLDDKEYIKVKNSIYLNSKAKYVIVCDSDEILYHENIREILEQDTGNIFNTIGWDIFSNEMPVDDFLEIQHGQFSPNYCKKVIFDPRIIINYSPGCHTCAPKYRVKPSNKTLTLFHYRNIGGVERLSKRHELYRKRLSRDNKIFGFGCHYSFPEEQRRTEWLAKYNASINFNLYDHKGTDPFLF